MINLEKPIFQWAEKYISLGWSLIPIKPNNKEPLIPWKEYQTRKANLEEVQEWLKKWPEMNLGVVTGKLSQIVVVDLDGLEGMEYGVLHKIVSGIQQTTGNGKQIFYKWTEHVDNSVSKIAPGVDIRGDAGFVVVPPSQHPNGKLYRWEKFVPNDMESFPKDLFVGSVAMEQSSSIGKESDGQIYTRLDIAKALEEMKIGNIDDTLVSILGRLRRDGWAAVMLKRYLMTRLSCWRQRGNRDILKKKSETFGADMNQNKQLNYQSMVNNPQLSYQFIPPQTITASTSFRLSVTTMDNGKGIIQTGFPTLDKYFEGGLKSERLFTIAARTGTGKTNFAIALALTYVNKARKCCSSVLNFNMRECGIDIYATLRHPETFRSHAFYVCDSFSPRIEQVEEAIKKIMPDVLDIRSY